MTEREEIEEIMSDLDVSEEEAVEWLEFEKELEII